MNLLQLLDDHGIDRRLHGEHHHISSSFVGTDCPLCSPTTGHFRLGFSLITGRASCYVCGRQDAGYMLSLLTGKSRDACATMLGSIDHVKVERKARGKLKMPSGCKQLGPAHRRYLQGRGLDPDEVVRLWKLQGTREDSNYPWSLVIPVHLNNEVVSFTTRKLHDRGHRYKSASPHEEIISLKQTLFGIDKVCNAAIVVEGPIGAITIGPGAVATFGLSFTDAQVRMLGKIHRRVIAFDNEDVAFRKAKELAQRLSLYRGETLIVELDSADPGEATSDEVNQLRGYLK